MQRIKTDKPKDCYVMLHSAMGDSVVAFRHLLKYINEYRDSKVHVIYNKNIDPFMKYWTWPDNVDLMPLEQTVHDFDNLHAFPYRCENQGIIDGFEANPTPEWIRDYRPYKIAAEEPLENNLKEFVPDLPNFIFGLNKYVVIQPISTVHQSYSPRCIEEELQTYEKFLINLIEHIHMYTSLSVVTVGSHSDADKFPHLNAMNSTNRYFNLMGHLSIEDLCTSIRYSSAVFGLSSSCINIGSYIFDKPVISWRLRPPWGDLFDSFLDPEKCKAIHRPFEQEMNFYSDFLKTHIPDAKQQNIHS
tara:strand:- start:146 stop:1051 length:906 start_codon:yes stop_codon:yes gene_type:complete